MANTGTRRCSATNSRGEHCRATVVNAAGWCAAHEPEGKFDAKKLGKASAEARRRPNPARVHPSLREYLRAEVPPAEVWQALKRVLEGENESARVAASRVLMDALSEPAGKVSVGVAVAEMRGELARAGLVIVERAMLEKPLEKLRAELKGFPALAVRTFVELGWIFPTDESGEELAELRAEVERLEQQLAAIPQAVREEFAVA